MLCRGKVLGALKKSEASWSQKQSAGHAPGEAVASGMDVDGLFVFPSFFLCERIHQGKGDNEKSACWRSILVILG